MPAGVSVNAFRRARPRKATMSQAHYASTGRRVPFCEVPRGSTAIQWSTVSTHELTLHPLGGSSNHDGGMRLSANLNPFFLHQSA